MPACGPTHHGGDLAVTCSDGEMYALGVIFDAGYAVTGQERKGAPTLGGGTGDMVALILEKRR